MLKETECKIRDLLADEALAEQILELIRQDEASRHADLVKRQSEGLKNARDRGVRLGRANSPPCTPCTRPVRSVRAPPLRCSTSLPEPSSAGFWRKAPNPIRELFSVKPLSN